MEAQQAPESVAQCKSCRGADGDGGIFAARAGDGQDKLAHKCSNCQVLKSGPLLVSSKGIGWTSWKKRWFILTRTSLIFFRSDPSASIQKGNEGNLTLGGIELNNSGSVVVKTDKKLLTVLFPDGRDGRTFTLKAETSEDLHEWKTALENALAQAPNAALVLGQNSMFRNDNIDAVESALEQGKDEELIKSTIVGIPALLALEDVDGKPSFLEKALRFIEQHGVKTEGILRQSADVEEVKHRFHEYEQGRNEFSDNEDAHLIADCIKYVLREMPASPVPASCCTALLEAFKGDRGTRVSRMYTVIYETFPEPNRRLLKRILEMMRVVVLHKSENRMSVSAAAACMAPLLLRPLLAGDCELDDDFQMGGDGSLQLLQAAAAANHAQAMIITLLEEYDKIFTGDYFHEDSCSEVYSDSDDASDEDEEEEEDDDEYEYEESTDNEAEDDDGCHEDDTHKSTSDADSEEPGQGSSDASSRSELEADLHIKEIDDHRSEISPSKTCQNVTDDKQLPPILLEPQPQHVEVDKQLPPVLHESQPQHSLEKEPSCKNRIIMPQVSAFSNDELLEQSNNSSVTEVCDPNKPPETIVTSTVPLSTKHIPPIGEREASAELASTTRRRTIWGRTSAKKNLSTESIEYTSEEESACQKLETTKMDLQSKLTEEVKENERLHASLERRKEVLRKRRMALQQDVERLQEQLEKERCFRAALEAGLMNVQHGLPISSALDKKTREDLEEIASAEVDVSTLNKQVADLQNQLSDNLQSALVLPCEPGFQQQNMTKRKDNGECATASTRRTSSSARRKDVLLKVPSRSETSQSPIMPFMNEMTMDLKNSTTDRTSKNNEEPPLSKVKAISRKSGKGEAILTGATYTDEKAQLESSKSKLSREPQKLCHQSSSQNETKALGINSSPLTEEASSIEAKMVSQTCDKRENTPLGTTSRSDSTQHKDSSLLANKPDKQYPSLTWEKSKSLAGGGSTKESSISTEVSIFNDHKKQENVPVGAASKNSKPQVQELASDQPASQQPQKQVERLVIIDSGKTVAAGSNSNEKASLPVPDVFPQKFNNALSGVNFDNMKSQQIPGSPLRRRQPARKTNTRMSNSATTMSLGSCISSLPHEDLVAGAGSTSKKSGTRVEEPVSSSALTKLTNRLNFLKERRVQLANELQAMDLSRLNVSEGPASKTDSR